MDSEVLSPEQRRELMASLQALLDLDSIRVLAALADGPRTQAELHALLKRPPAPGRGPLIRLIQLELVRADDGEPARYQLERERFFRLNGALHRLSQEQLAQDRVETPGLAELSEEDQRVVRNYLRGEQIVELPAGPQRMLALARWLVGRFERGRRYPERELNAIIKRHHPDFATLRRELVDFGLMAREREVYWRLPDE
jgi:hypothetical protein